MAPPDLDFPPGTPIAGQYVIIERKASGANGVVYSALDNDRRRVALKFLKEYPQGEDLDSVLREIALGQLVKHPRVCELHKIAVTQDGVMFLSMEYIDGRDLEELIVACGHVSRDDGIRKAIEICSGLAAIHEKGVVHRDLKPANVMIDKQGHAKITDFGVAVPAKLRTVARGTPLYMAPEAWRNAISDPSADIYSFGLLLFKLFTGRSCLGEPKTMDDLWRAHAHARFRRPSAEAAGLDASIDHIVSRCLAEKPDDRPPADKLRRLLEPLCP